MQSFLRRHRAWMLPLCGLGGLVGLVMMQGCEAAGPSPSPTTTPTASPTASPSPTPTPGPAQFFSTSLHATRAGLKHFYSQENGGFETLTGVQFEDLDCRHCHAPTFANGDPVGENYTPSCADCHADLANPTVGLTDSICLGCHTRQAAERDLFSDVHRDAGFTCTSCHTAAEMHGDGTAYNSHLDTPGPQCVDCHDDPPTNTAHAIHSATVACAACHVQSVITCYNCHFDTQVAGAGRRPYGSPRGGFKMLVNFREKVYPATFQSLVHEGETFYVIAPYFAHTITSEVNCDDCHSGDALAEYDETGIMTVAQFGMDGALEGPTGVIPIPPDWTTALKIDFVDYAGEVTDPIEPFDPDDWQFIKNAPDLTQMLYGEPLTAEQLESLRN